MKGIRFFTSRRSENLLILEDGSFVSEMRPIAFAMSGAGAIQIAPGWFYCNGATLSRTTFKRLFDEIGTTYNIGGEAGTDFRLPDLCGRSPLPHADGKTGTTRVAAVGGLSNATTPGGVGGADTVALVAAHLPTHTHGQSFALSGGSHFHGAGSITIPIGNQTGGAGTWTVARRGGSGGSAGQMTISGTLGAATHSHANADLSGSTEDGTADGLVGSAHPNAHPHLPVSGMVIRS